MRRATPPQSTIREQCRAGTPSAIIDQIENQERRFVDARERIDREGIVVRDMKGSVIPHPAIKIEQDACKLIAELMARWKK